MTDPIGDELAALLVAEVARSYPVPDLLAHALSDEPPDAAGWQRLVDMGLADVAAVASPHGSGPGLGLGPDVLATVFRAGGSVLLPLAAQEQAVVLAPVLGALAGASARAGELLDGIRSGAVVGGGGGAVSPGALRVDDDAVTLDGVPVWTGPGATVAAVVGPDAAAVLDLATTPVAEPPATGVDAGQGLRALTGTVRGAEVLVLTAPAATVVWRRWQLALLAHVLGVADAALDQATSYARERTQFGRPIGSFQGVSHPLAEALVAVTAGESGLARLAALLVDGEPGGTGDAGGAGPVDEMLAGLAFWLPVKARAVCETAIQVHGGIGFTWEQGLHLFYRRALTIQSLLGGRVAAAQRVQAVRARRAAEAPA